MHADVPQPGRQPVERLERGAVGGLLERAPLVLDRIEIVVQRQFDMRRRALGSAADGASILLARDSAPNASSIWPSNMTCVGMASLSARNWRRVRYRPINMEELSIR